MPTNIEIKVKITNEDEFRIATICDAAGLQAQELKQTDIYFSLSKYHNADSSSYEKYRFNGTCMEFIQYTRYNESQKNKTSYYKKCVVEFEEFARDIDKRPVLTTVTKERVLYLWKDEQTRIHIDNVHGLDGVFLELEVVLNDGQTQEEGRKIADDLLDLFAITALPISISYCEMLLESNRR